MDKEEARSVLDGLLLGDGNLDFGGGVTARFRISREDTKEYRDYLLGIAEALEMLRIGVSPDQPKSRTKTSKGRASQMLDLDSRASPILTKQYHLWIVSNKPKRRKVPDYFMKITPLTLTYWFESDGNTHRPKKEKNLVVLELSSCQFGHEGNIRLRELLMDIGIEARLDKRWDKGNREYRWSLTIGNAAGVNQFLDIVESHIHLPYVYKMERPWLKRLMVNGKQQRGRFDWKDLPGGKRGWVKAPEKVT